MDDSDVSPVHTVDPNPESNRTVNIWHQGRAKINRLLGNAPSKTYTETYTERKPIYQLPYEIAETIIAHLAENPDSLKACSLTCRSWYIAVVPHIHHTFILEWNESHDMLRPLFALCEPDLTPFVKNITVRKRLSCHWFTPQEFTPRGLSCFSTFTNVRTLKLDYMDISRFIPGIERYFEHLSPTLRSIVLWSPSCTPRQLSHFLSLFSGLENISIRGGPTLEPAATIPDTKLVPFSPPELRGELRLYGSQRVETWTRLIALCGGLRFRYMNLRNVGACVPILFEACAKTLETLRLYPSDDSVCE